ncbi:MAG: hypothetical protein AB1486_27965 [Planctomycetota bacterium]
MKTLCAAVAVAVLSWGALALPPLQECDMSKIGQGHYCEKCQKLLAKEDFGTKPASYLCETCGTSFEKAGKCEKCDKDLKKVAAVKGVCLKCFEKPKVVEVCEKYAFVCPKCSQSLNSPGRCEKCKEKLEKTPDFALIKYECPSCKASSLEAGKCTSEGCEARGKKLERVCTKAGKGAHVTADNALRNRSRKKG